MMVSGSASSAYHNSNDPEQHREIHALFSAKAVKQCSGSSQTRVYEQIQVITGVIDDMLMNIAEEGYVLPAEASNIAATLQEIRRTGKLDDTPYKSRNQLKVTCMTPLVGGAAPGGKMSAEQGSETPPSKAWARLSPPRYDFVNKSK